MSEGVAPGYEGFTDLDESVVCLDSEAETPCAGAVEYRVALSATGVSYPRCSSHWEARLVIQEGINERYPTHAPSDWSPLDAGEHWDEDY